MVSQPQILYLEDEPLDFELVCGILSDGGVSCAVTRVETQEQFVAALEANRWDLVFSDFQLRGFDGYWALAESLKRAPLAPFIFISGVIGEETAIESLKRGASDYVFKQRLNRLVPCIQHALQQSAERRARLDAEQKILEQAALLDLTQDGIVVFDLSGKIMVWNKGAERLYGWSGSEAMGKDVAALLHPHNRSPFQTCLDHVLCHGEWNGELDRQAHGGGKLIVQSRWTLMRTTEGLPRAVLIVDTNITDKKQIEAQLLRAQRLESIGTLAGGIAHDLNNVLAPILMSVHLLRDEMNSPTAQKLLNTVESSARRGSAILKQVLTFARGLPGRRTAVSPRQIVQEVQRIIQETFPKSIVLQVSVPDDLRMVSGDATQLQQVLINLTVNARDAMPAGGTLLLSAENVRLDENMVRMMPMAKAGFYVLLQVADTGSGIPAEHLDQIFDPFFSTKEPDKGTGLGLSTALGIIRSHEGFMQVESEVQQGSRFKVYLPALSGVETATTPSPAPTLSRGQGETILVVEDEENVRDITRQTLERYGYRVLTAVDGAEAVALFAGNQGQIRLVLTDVMMPFMDGVATMRALRRINPQINLVIASGLSSQTRGGDFDDLGVQAILTKPFNAETLVETVHRVLRRDTDPPAPLS